MKILSLAWKLWNQSVYPALALSVVFTAYFVVQTHRLIQDQDWLDHSDRAIGKAILLQKLMLDAETGVRGYLLSGEDVTFNPFREQEEVFDKTLDQAMVFVDDNPVQVERLRSIKETFGTWVARARTIKSSDNLNQNQNRTYFGVGEGRRIMDVCRRLIDSFLLAEQELRESRAARLRLEIPRAIVSGAAITLLLRVLGVLTLRRLRGKS